METFYLAGSADDLEFAKAEYIGDYLVKRHPQIGFVKDMRHPCEWLEFRKLLVESRGFDIPGVSPLVWRNNGRLIGSAPDFNMYVHDKYGVVVPMDEALMEEIRKENILTCEAKALEDQWTPLVGMFKKVWRDGIIFEGTWKDHKPKKGTITFSDDSTYTGSLLDGKFHGSGVRKYLDGSKFRGIYVHGKREGMGIFQDVAGNEYEGRYSDDMCHGKGTRRWPDGREYTGEWKENHATGIGRESIPVDDGGGANVYEGHFVDGAREGRGVMTYDGGEVYDGEWRSGKRHGEGKMTWPEKDKLWFKGIFKDDRPTYGTLCLTGAGLTAAFPGEAPPREKQIVLPAAGETRGAGEGGGDGAGAVAAAAAAGWLGQLRERCQEWLSEAKGRVPREPGAGPEALPGLWEGRSAPPVAAQVVTEAVWKDVRQRVTKNGVTLYHCLTGGPEPKKAGHGAGGGAAGGAGFVAAESGVFDTLREVTDLILTRLSPHIAAGHPGAVGRLLGEFDPRFDQHPTDLDPGNLRLPAPSAGLALTAHSVSIQVDRALQGVVCPALATLDERRRAEEVLVKALLSLEGPLAGDYLPLAGSESYAERSGGMSAEEEALLRADGSLLEQKECPEARDWPDARGVFRTRPPPLASVPSAPGPAAIPTTPGGGGGGGGGAGGAPVAGASAAAAAAAALRRVVAHVNGPEHLVVYSSQPGFDLAGALEAVRGTLKGMEDKLKEDGASFAHSERLGHLVSSMDKVGNAMSVGVTLRLPRLAKRVALLSALSLRIGAALTPTTLRKSNDAAAAAGGGGGAGAAAGLTEWIKVSVRGRLGESEVHLVSRAHHAALAAARHEAALRGGRKTMWLLDDRPRILLLTPPAYVPPAPASAAATLAASGSGDVRGGVWKAVAKRVGAAHVSVRELLAQAAVKDLITGTSPAAPAAHGPANPGPPPSAAAAGPARPADAVAATGPTMPADAAAAAAPAAPAGEDNGGPQPSGEEGGGRKLLPPPAAAEIPAGADVEEEPEAGTVAGIVEEQIKGMDECRDGAGWLVEGCPRDAAQLEALQQAGLVADKIIIIDVPDSDVAAACAGRRVDRVTGMVYLPPISLPPGRAGTALAARLVQRPRDADPARVAQRVARYRRGVEEVRAAGGGAGRVVDGRLEVEALAAEVLAFLLEPPEHAPPAPPAPAPQVAAAAPRRA